MTKNLFVKLAIFSLFLINSSAEASAKIGLKQLTFYTKLFHKSSDSLAVFCCMMGISSFYTAKICWEKKEIQENGQQASDCKTRAASVMTAVGGTCLLLLSGTYFLNRYKIKRELNNILNFVTT